MWLYFLNLQGEASNLQGFSSLNQLLASLQTDSIKTQKHDGLLHILINLSVCRVKFRSLMRLLMTKVPDGWSLPQFHESFLEILEMELSYPWFLVLTPVLRPKLKKSWSKDGTIIFRNRGQFRSRIWRNQKKILENSWEIDTFTFLTKIRKKSTENGKLSKNPYFFLFFACEVANYI